MVSVSLRKEERRRAEKLQEDVNQDGMQASWSWKKQSSCGSINKEKKEFLFQVK